MSRFVLVKHDGKETLLKEAVIKEEEHLQEVIKSNPQLIPVEDLGLGELLVVGRETTLPSGAIDLLCLDQNGQVIIVEFKKGPENSDHRRVIAQLLDYGAYLWQMTFAQFEQKAVEYFKGKRCSNDLVKGCKNLKEAYDKVWASAEQSDDEGAEPEWESFRETVMRCLESGEFYYLIVSRRVDAVTRRALEYLNSLSSLKTAAVEIDHFEEGDREIFVPRAILSKGPQRSAVSKTSQEEFLGKLESNARKVFERLFDKIEGMDETFIYWGTVGFSFRVYFRSKPESILWGYPAETSAQPEGIVQFARPYGNKAQELHDVLLDYSQKIESEIKSVYKTKGKLQAKVPQSVNLNNIDRILTIIEQVVDKIRTL